MFDDENYEVIHSSLSQDVTRDGKTVSVEIYGDGEGKWILEVLLHKITVQAGSMGIHKINSIWAQDFHLFLNNPPALFGGSYNLEKDSGNRQ